MNLKNPIYGFSKDELLVLYKFFQIDPQKEDAIKSLDKKISKLTLSAGGFLQEGLTYSQLVDIIAKKHNLYLEKSNKANRERELFLKLFQKKYEEMSTAEKAEFNLKLEKSGLSSNEISSLTAFTSIGAAQLSGFGIYMLASSTASAMAGLFGVTLSFGFYTTMSSMISYAIGPVGFFLAAIPLYKTFKDVKSTDEAITKIKNMGSGLKKVVTGDYESALVVFEYVTALRIKKSSEFEREILLHKEAIVTSEVQNSQLLEECRSQLDILRTKESEIEDVKKELKHLIALAAAQRETFDTKMKKQERVAETIKSSRDLIEKLEQQKHLLENQIN